MILADIPWLNISLYTLIGIFAIVCFLMCVLILMQRPKNEGLGAAFGSGTTDQLFGARTTTVLQKGTVWLATIFFILVFLIGGLIRKKSRGGLTLLTNNPAPAAPALPVPPPNPGDATVPPVTVPPGESPLEPDSAVPPGEPVTPPGTVTPPPVIPDSVPPGETPPPPVEPAPPAEKPAPADKPE